MVFGWTVNLKVKNLRYCECNTEGEGHRGDLVFYVWLTTRLGPSRQKHGPESR